MKCSIFKKSALVLIGLFVFSLAGLNAQSKSKIYRASDIVKDKLETIQAKLNLSDDQLAKVKAIDLETEGKLEAAPDNTAARRVYEWRDSQYKTVLTAAQYRTYLKEKQAIVDEAQASWNETHGTVIEVN